MSSVWGVNDFASRRTLKRKDCAVEKASSVWNETHVKWVQNALKWTGIKANTSCTNCIWGYSMVIPPSLGIPWNRCIMVYLIVLAPINGGVLFLANWPMIWPSQSWKRPTYWWHGALCRESKDQDAKCHNFIKCCNCFSYSAKENNTEASLPQLTAHMRHRSNVN